MSTGLTTLECDTRQIREYVIDSMQAGLVSNIVSSPGMGKSSIIWDIAKQFNLKVLDTRLSTKAPEDLSGLPNFIDVPIWELNDQGVYAMTQKTQRKASFIPFENFPVEGDPLPVDEYGRPMDGWLVFFDEFNSGSKMMQAAAYQIILDRYVGLKKLHPRVIMVCAGNHSTDRAIVNPLGTAMQSRLIHLHMKLVPKIFFEDVVHKFQWDTRISSYLEYMPGKIMDFKPEHNEKTFCCPRTWEFMNKLIKGKTFDMIKKTRSDGTEYVHYEMEEKTPMYAGSITSGVALEFVQFTKVFSDMPKFRDIMNDPENLAKPKDPPTHHATIGHIVEHVDEKSLETVAKYVNRFDPTFRLVFFRTLNIRKPQLRQHPQFAKMLLELKRYMYDD